MIISSIIQSASLQKDNRYVVRELHVDDLGNEYPLDYIAESNDVIQPHLIESADKLNAILSESQSPDALQQAIDGAQEQIDELQSQIDMASQILSSVGVRL